LLLLLLLLLLQVLYLDVAAGPALSELQRFGDAVISHFCSQGSEVCLDEGGRGFTPHVTVAKTSRLRGGRHRQRQGEWLHNVERL
jgi:hypothetical protein